MGRAPVLNPGAGILRGCVKACLPVVALLFASAVAAADEEILASMLHDFLANAATASAHEKFWADDLVYSSSAGQRFGKADIMRGFETDADASADETPGIVYSGEDVDVRVYGDMAVVAFKLVGTPTDPDAASEIQYFYNTGTFLKRDGVWQVVAWQATKIPPAE